VGRRQVENLPHSTWRQEEQAMSKLGSAVAWALLIALGWGSGPAGAQELFAKRVGAVKYGDIKGGVLEVPYLFWGGDVATFHANGGRETKADSIFGKMGLKLKLVDGDNFHQQVRNYVSGQSPFVRGTFSMLGQASEVLNTNDKTKPVLFLQMTWSAGDHMVAREGLKTLNDLKGKKVALQEDGPHVGMLDDVLRTAGLKWKDVTVVWTKEVTGKDSPPEKFRADNSIDACFVVTPDMQGLTGGLTRKGTGAEQTVKGAHVLISTVNMKRSIADVYAVRKDFFDRNRALVEKFAAGYLKACDELLRLRAKAGKDRTAQAKYRQVLELSQAIFGKDKVSSLVEASKLIADAVFVGLPGNRAFFKDRGNLSGFGPKQQHALDLAVGEKYVEGRATFQPVDFDYRQIAKLADLPAALVDQPPVSRSGKAAVDEAIYTFIITFGVNERQFPEEKYADAFKKAVEQASLFGNAVVTIRGHADPTNVLRYFIADGVKNKALTRKQEGEKETYYLAGDRKIDLDDPKNMKAVIDLVKKGSFPDAQDALEGCEKLAQARANRVHESLLKYATNQKLILDKNQVRPLGLSILEPVVPRPKDDEERAKNRRVEFRLYKVRGGAAPVASADDPVYDY
jgi:ABC-type nitrate/sulfonate/bicarbonate transport system substrate-binding protein/outer membrane protein OmpA-like peptidoglycan-associated protein